MQDLERLGIQILKLEKLKIRNSRKFETIKNLEKLNLEKFEIYKNRKFEKIVYLKRFEI